jgi:hypothetical protein
MDRAQTLHSIAAQRRIFVRLSASWLVCAARDPPLLFVLVCPEHCS